MQSIERNGIFDLAFRFVTETSENIFLTGKAGSGKTTFLRYLKENCTKNIVVAAPTGVAAINAGGVTLHSLFQLPFHPFLPTPGNKKELLAKTRYSGQRQQLLRKMEMLVIDEISMVRCDALDAIDTLLRHVRRNPDLPFGGVQLLCIGDLYQLSPVAQRQEWHILKEYYESPYFFDSLVIKEQMPLLIELDKIYRQKERSFIELLNKVRDNDMESEDHDLLHERYIPGFRPPENEHYIILTSHNNQADLINQQHLHALNVITWKYDAIIEGEFAGNLYPAEKELLLKEGAQVMFLKNDLVQKKYYNGKIGVVRSLEKDRIIVECDGTMIGVLKDVWENAHYTLNRTDGKLEQETLGTFIQYPLRLAWAITIHKSQGLSFDKVMVDAGAAFSSGQVYVALSRCTSLEGIVLMSKIPPVAIFSNEHVAKGQQLLTPKGPLADRFRAARRLFTLQLLDEIFSFNEITGACDKLGYLVDQHRHKLNTGAVEWIDHLKGLLREEKNLSLRFISRVTALAGDGDGIENNQPLQQRITDAANYFIPRLETCLGEVQDHSLVTEHKETATAVNEQLGLLYLSFYTVNYYLQYCRSAFSITGFLQHKLRFASPQMKINCYAADKNQSVADVSNTELFDTLKRWRDMVCAETGQPIYMVANQASLKEICLYLPLTKKDLVLISGFGKARAEKYGDDILEAVESYCSRYDIATNMHAKEKRIKPKRMEGITDTKTISLSLYKEGKGIPAIAEERKLAVATIEGHLAHFIGTGNIDINEVVSKEKQGLVKQAVAKHGQASLRTLIADLPTDISYADVRMVVASIKSSETGFS